VDGAAAKRPTFVRRQSRLLATSLALLVGLAWILREGGLPLLPPAGTLGHVNAWCFAGFVLGMLFHLLTRFARCHFLIAPIAPLSLRRLMAINAIGMALITFLPLRIGEAARPAMLRERGRLSAWAVTGTVGAERVLDGVVFSALLLLGLAFATFREPLPSHIGSLRVPAAYVPRAARIASIVFCVAFSVMAAFYWNRDLARRLTERWVGKVLSPALGRRVADIVGRTSDGLGFLTNPRYSLPYLAVTVASVVGHLWAILLLARAVGIWELTFAQSMVVVGVLALGFGMPNAPGFFGAVQLALYAGLAVCIAPEKVVHEGAVLVFLFYVTYLALVLIMAGGALLIEYAVPQPKMPPSAPEKQRPAPS